MIVVNVNQTYIILGDAIVMGVVVMYTFTSTLDSNCQGTVQLLYNYCAVPITLQEHTTNIDHGGV